MTSRVAVPSTASDASRESLTPVAAPARDDPPSAASTNSSPSTFSASSRLDPFVSFLFPSSEGASLARARTGSTKRGSKWGNNNGPSKKRSALNAELKRMEPTNAKLARTLSFTSDRQQQQDDGTSVSELVDEVVTEDPSNKDKRLCLTRSVSEPRPAEDTNLLLEMLPQEMLEYCCLYLDPVKDRASASKACSSLRDVFHGRELMRITNLCGNNRNVPCYFTADDDADDVLMRLEPYLKFNNCSALYIAGMIHLYVKDQMNVGVKMLEKSAQADHDESLYSLGLIYRDMDAEKAMDYMRRAYSLGDFSAQMEVVSAANLRDQVGEPSAHVLRQWMGSLTLHKLLRKCFVENSRFRGLPSSHCWNPICGRWAYKSPRDRNNKTVHIKCARMKMCSSCRRAKYCSKICQVYDWRSGRHKFECQFIG